MSLFEGILLGFIQGITEFLPISSSGHLILVREFFEIPSDNGLAVDAILQLATILAVLVYFFKDILNLVKSAYKVVLNKPVGEVEKKLLNAILLGTIPATILGYFIEGYMESTFRNSYLVALTLILGSLLMLVAEYLAKQNKEITPKKGFLIGVFQSLALIPGISRSGATISGGLLLGLTREQATRFSFLLAFPIILGSGLKKLVDLYQTGTIGAGYIPLGAGFIVSFCIGIAAIHCLIKYLKNHKLTVFIWYRVILAILIFTYF